MINEFNNVEELNEHYFNLLAQIDNAGEILGETMEIEMRKQLQNSYELDAKLLSYNDKYNLSLLEKKLKVDRLKSKLDYKLKVKKIKSDLSIDKQVRTKELKNGIKEKQQQLKPPKREPGKFSKLFRSIFKKREKIVKE